jgi:hypothetical protein
MPIVLQGALVLGIAALALLPPRNGVMLIAPLVPGDTAATLRMAVGAGAMLVGDGPYPGALVVRGSRAALAGPVAARGALLLAGRFSGCGDAATKG